MEHGDRITTVRRPSGGHADVWLGASEKRKKKATRTLLFQKFGQKKWTDALCELMLSFQRPGRIHSNKIPKQRPENDKEKAENR